ncbi:MULTISPECIES: RagB/SusD family nutrient uptake outer membrane protein [Sphingobacterium]|uniref:RagB/SusD family nutrient uptake outer membrane protein n=1 Tax=Sphingobacterium TaxID=28453 RepID=UPI001045267D|nr:MULTISPECIES: RagB/SusD family nutrient uptake outer membrane protein [Sphingobacterium]MCW2263166.1 tetratricopeptide (TPR) repeat protein [Sphingobacterium kitahiroshimense]TCR11850.1 SusD-like starch-binding protein associating with outer membrane [Sphingobacterium sp. JUb78]
MKNQIKISYKIVFAGLFLCSAMITTSCRKFVEVDTFSSRTLKYTTDYEALINNSSNFGTSYILPLVTGDDVDTKVEAVQNSWSTDFQNAFIWSAQFFSQEQQDGGWNNLYKQVQISNTILNGVFESENGTLEAKNRIAAEAKVHRAFAYLALVNQYAPIYNPAQASTQMGVPLLLTPDLFQNLARASLQKVYDQIISDLTSAVDYLPNYPTFNYHPSKIAIYGLMSRTYLFMRDFEKAAGYADLALALSPKLNDLQVYKGNISTFPRLLVDPEVLFSKTSAGSFMAPINPDLVNLYQATDLRFQMWLGTNVFFQGYQYVRPNFTYQGIYVGVKVPEILLNRAELYARAGNLEKTVEFLNKLRINRFEKTNYIPLQIVDISGDPLQAVINERRREFVGTDLRWFDMRRLTLDSGYYKSVTRTYKGVNYTLEASSARFVYPINQDILNLNPEIGQNPR